MGRILGIDLGTARVGVAASDELGMLAHPVETIPVAGGSPLGRIVELVDKLEAETVVVGMPRNMDGSRGSAAERALEFVGKLREAIPCPVVTWDERLTTMEASRALRAAGRDARRQKAVIDQAAAQIILQSWLDSRA